MLDNRELAALIWLTIALCLALSRKRYRASFESILRVFFQPVILLPLSLLFAWVGLEVWLGARLGLWNTGLAKATILWAFGAGVVLFFATTTATGSSNLLRRIVAGTIGVTVFLEFFLNLFVMSLPAELVLQPVAATLASLAVVSGMRDDSWPHKAVVDGLLVLLGFGLLAFTVWQFFQNWQQIDGAQLLRGFLLPIWLTVGLLPFLFFLRLYVVYDSAWRRLNHMTPDARARWRARLALSISFHIRRDELRRVPRYVLSQLAQAPSWAAAREAIAAFRKVEREREQAAADEQERLQRYAGVEGTDADGRRLDRREFKQTMAALRWLHTCQMGWYRNHGSRYRPDLLDKLGDSFAHHGFPAEHGITLKVGVDGQGWYAWRRTVAGWCFAIGAAGPPPDEWEFDGPEPPDGFPGEDPTWGEAPFSDEVNRNWH